MPREPCGGRAPVAIRPGGSARNRPSPADRSVSCRESDGLDPHSATSTARAPTLRRRSNSPKGSSTHAPGIALSLASTHSDAGDPATALRLTLETLAKYEGLNSLSMQPQVRACALVNAADCLVELGRYDEAQARANEALQFAHEHQLHAVVALSLEHLAVAATLMSVDQNRCSPAKAADAARLLGFVGAARNTLGIEEAVGQKYDQMLSMIRTAIGADEFSRRLAAGATMTEDEAMAAARALE